VNDTTGKRETGPLGTVGVYGALFVLGAVEGMIGSFQYSRAAKPVPLAALESLAPKLPRRREIVAYCRGPYCVYADEAVQELTHLGFRARRLTDGFPHWKRAGLPIAAGEGG